MISEKPALVRDRLGSAAYALYEEYRSEEHAIRVGSTGPFVHFTVGSDVRHDHDAIAMLRERLATLAERVSSRGGALSMRDFETSLQLFGANPDLALLNDYRIVERIARAAFERLVGHQLRRPTPFPKILKALAIAPSPVPEDVLEIMRIVARLGKTPHTIQPARKPSLNDDTEFFMSFVGTIKITEWFLINWKFGEEFAL